MLVNCGMITKSSIKGCFCFQVHRSNRTLASISSSSVSHTSKDLRLTKVNPSEVNFFDKHPAGKINCVFISDGCRGVRQLPPGLAALRYCVSDLCPRAQRRPGGRQHFTDCGGGVDHCGLELSKRSKDPGHPLIAQLDCYRRLRTNVHP